MKRKTYEVLYQAHLGNIREKALLEAKEAETDSFYQNLIDIILENTRLPVAWNIAPFTHEFRLGSPRERLNETVMAFILRLVAIHKEEQYIRAYRRPESFHALAAWESIVRTSIVCLLSLLYNVRWTTETVLRELEPTVLRLLGPGDDPFALRKLMQSVGITFALETPYAAEREFAKLNFLHVGQYSSFYWRTLHWMAEACHLRKDPEMRFYKQMWLELVQGSLYRTLRCGECMYHFKTMLIELKSQLSDPDADFPKLWFEMHNRVHALRRDKYTQLQEPNYTELEYEEDRAFMHKAFSP